MYSLAPHFTPRNPFPREKQHRNVRIVVWDCGLQHGVLRNRGKVDA